MNKFDTQERQIQRQARIRGSGKRVIQAQKLEIVEEQPPNSSSDIADNPPEIELPQKESSVHVDVSAQATPQKRKRGRPKKKRAGGRKRRTLEEPEKKLSPESDTSNEVTTVLKEIPDLSHEDSQSRIKPAVPLVLGPDDIISKVGTTSAREKGAVQLRGKQEMDFFKVLQSLIENFEVATPYSDEFKLHVLNAIEELRDRTAQLKKTSESISKIQKEKDQLRQRILAVKDQSKNVAMQMQEFVETKNRTRQEYEWTKSIYERIETLKREMKGDAPSKTSTSETVVRSLSTLKGVLSPKIGVVAKLRQINGKLKQKEAKLPTV
ncbi:hypothetical protein KGF57_001713 [Candida theae]|uniref:Inner kinetochore subunit AME1 domain-containing protein n=1 Tax=Candida theae TaxID=1198502 RepID=A0AAD5BGR3_9ASCO|nr:uncharacterized protein KGF57_001713 [Candida theae]KAI5961476.1 hypothetical protein KGF57_001713 [Candida theae]